jgi:hypothetical protein
MTIAKPLCKDSHERLRVPASASECHGREIFYRSGRELLEDHLQSQQPGIAGQSPAHTRRPTSGPTDARRKIGLLVAGVLGGADNIADPAGAATGRTDRRRTPAADAGTFTSRIHLRLPTTPGGRPKFLAALATITAGRHRSSASPLTRPESRALDRTNRRRSADATLSTLVSNTAEEKPYPCDRGVPHFTNHTGSHRWRRDVQPWRERVREPPVKIGAPSVASTNVANFMTLL